MYMYVGVVNTKGRVAVIGPNKICITVFPRLVRARTSQSNYALSNRGRELIKGAPYYISRVYLLWSMRV